jgi:quinoprotein glucose dehydrogenase
MEIPMRIIATILLAGIVAPIAHCQTDWPAYGYDGTGQRYSPLKQIDAGNVMKLRKAWQYGISSDAAGPSSATQGPPATEAVPIMVDGMLYTPTVNHTIVALEPESGEEIWKYDLSKANATLRGVTYWSGDKDNPPAILAGTS